MNNMGGSCSIHSRRSASVWHEQRDGVKKRHGSKSEHKKGQPARHSVESELPDDTIASLYPIEENYKIIPSPSPTHLRSPKSLTELCMDQVCRSLPDLDGSLPPGLPQDLVNALVKSLIDHAALNATTLRALRNCELEELSLAGCRGVKDDWLSALSRSSSESYENSPVCSSPMTVYDSIQPMDIGIGMMHYKEYTHDCLNLKPPANSHQDDGSSSYCSSSSSCSTSSFHSASSTPLDIPPHPQSSVTSTITLLDLRGSQCLTDKGLLHLSDLSALEIAKLDNCHSITGSGLRSLSNSYRLHTLSLANCRRLTDGGILHIRHLTRIKALSLHGCRCLTNASLEALAELKAIQKLDLSQCDLITDVGLHHLHSLHELRELSLGWCRSITDSGLEILCQQPFRENTLRILRLARCVLLTDRGMQCLAGLQCLEELDLNGCSKVTSKGLGDVLGQLENLLSLDVSYCTGILRSSWQGKIPSLQSLALGFSAVQDHYLLRFTSLPSLQELILDSCPIGDWTISHFADHNVTPNLTSLDLADTDLTDAGMAHLPKFEHMTKLSLFYCNISNRGLQHLSKMISLQVLNLDSREISDEGLFYLKSLKQLRCLDIFSGRITDAGCLHLSYIHSLESLELCGGGVGDLGCVHLAKLRNLTSLNLSQNERISNRGAAALAFLTNLRVLNLSNTRVNSAALQFLTGLVKLQSLALYGCRGIDDDANVVSMLHDELPSLKCLRLNAKKRGDMFVDGEGDVIDDEDDFDDDDDDSEGVTAARIHFWMDDDSSSSSSSSSDSSSEESLLHEDEIDEYQEMEEDHEDDADNVIEDMDLNDDDGLVANDYLSDVGSETSYD